MRYFFFAVLLARMCLSGVYSRPSCERHLEIEKLQKTLVERAETYRINFSDISMDDRVFFDFSSRKAHRGGQVLYLGSGPDVFSSVLNFPLARNFHFWDTFSGWGKGPGEMLLEILRRVSALGPGVSLRLVDSGWLTHLDSRLESEFKSLIPAGLNMEPSEFFWSYDFSNEFRERVFYSEKMMDPIVLEANWGGGASGIEKQSKRFSLHLGNFSNPSHHEVMERRIEKIASALVGIMSLGVSWSENMSFQKNSEEKSLMLPWLKKLGAGGVFLGDEYEDYPLVGQFLRQYHRSHLSEGKLSRLSEKYFLRWGSSVPIKLQYLMYEKTSDQE